ncbi:Hypothetical predicted protein, partial [Pelobates cultripes]
MFHDFTSITTQWSKGYAKCAQKSTMRGETGEETEVDAEIPVPNFANTHLGQAPTQSSHLQDGGIQWEDP